MQRQQAGKEVGESGVCAGVSVDVCEHDARP